MDELEAALTMAAYDGVVTLIAEERGWNRDEHQAALDSGDIDEIGLTHPINFLTEDEAEEFFT